MHPTDDDRDAVDAPPLPLAQNPQQQAVSGSERPELAASAPLANAIAMAQQQQLVDLTSVADTGAAKASEGDGRENDVDEAEVLFLIADFLKRRSKCQKAADVLIEELTEHKLLRDTVNWQGTTKTSTYADYRLRHRDIAPGHLLGLMKNATRFDSGSPTAARGNAITINARSSFTPRGSKSSLTPRGSKSKSTAQGFIGSKSLLMKSRLANQRLNLSADERKALAKDIVNQLFALRSNLRTQKVVERVVHKYERLREYTEAASIEDLPVAVRNEIMMVQGLTQQTDNLTSLAADVRALRQLMQLKHEQRMIDSKMRVMMEKATRAALFQTQARTGPNEASLLQRRQVRPQATGALPSSFVYSRMRRLKTLDGHLQIRAFCLTYDKTGKFVITGADDRLVKIWSLATGDLLFTLRGHVGNITDLAVNSSNTLLASSSDDKTVRVWELSTGAPVAVLLGHSSVVNAVRFHPTKNVVVTASNDGRCFCYTLPEIPQRADTSEPETKLQTAQRLNASKAYLLSLHPVFSLTHGVLRQGVRSCKVLCLSFSRCGKYVITGSQDGVGRVWDVSVFSGSDAPVSASQYQHEGELQINIDAVQTTVPVAEPADTGAIPAPVAAVAQVLPPTNLLGQPPAALLPVPQQGGELAQNIVVPASGAPALDPPLVLGGIAAEAPGVALPLLPLPLAIDGQAPATPRQQTQLPQLPQNGVVPLASIADVDVPSLPTKEPISLLQGHTGPITNIVYSHDGKLIATASIKDGTTRLWQWDKKHKKLHHKVLLADEPDENEQLASLYGVQTRRKSPPAVDTLSWSKDDRRLITLHSVKPDSHAADADWKQRVRVWDPATGKLLMTLAAVDKEKQNGHTNAVFVMDVHPTDWRIVVTAGYDGRIFLWDISTGTMLKSFTNMSPDAELVPMLDGGFIPNGNGFCFTDRIGRLLIFGTGSGEQYAATPVQQYFQSDYAALITDRNFNVLDRETQQIPSLMDPGPLVDIYQIEYPHQPPHLMRGSGAALTAKQYAENRRLRIQQATEMEIKCRVHHAQDDKSECEVFPSAIYRPHSPASVESGGAEGDAALATSSYRLNGAPVALSELRRRHSVNAARRGELARRRSNTSLDERDTSILNIEISSEDDHSDEDFQAPTRTRTNGEDDDEDEEDEDDDDDDDDDDDEDEEEEDEDDLLSDRDDMESPRFRRRRQARGTATAASSASTRAAAFPRRGGRRLQESPPDNDESSDDSEDDGRMARRRTRRNAVAAAAQRRRRVVESDEDELRGSGANIRNDDHEFTDDHRNHGQFDQRAGRESMDDQSEVVVETNDGFIMGDNQLDKFDRTMTYEQVLYVKRQQLGTTRENTTTENGDEALIPCAFCHEGDDGGVLKLPGDSMGVHPIINGSQRLFVHDQCAIASPLCFNRGGKWYNVTKEIRRGRSLICVQCKKRGATVGCTVASCPKSYHWKCAIGCGWSMNQIAFYCPNHESMRSEEERKEQEGDEDNDPVTKRFGHTFHRDWLQKLSLASTQSYVPQVGDYVTYFPQGHQDYLRLFPIRGNAFITRFRKFFALKCRVVDVKYVFPTLSEYGNCSSIKCEISVAVLAVPSAAFNNNDRGEEEAKSEGDDNVATANSNSALFDSDSSPFASFTGVDAHLQPVGDVVSERYNFQFLYHPHDVSNFLVLDHVYEKGVRGKWEIGERVEMPIVELNEYGVETPVGFTYGVISDLVPKFIDSERRILSPWECVQVDWEDKDLDGTNVSPWEIEPVAGTARRLEKRQRDVQRRESLLFRSRAITGGKRTVLLQEIDTIMNLSISRDFLYPVDSAFLDYVLMVANPVDLTKIQLRVRNGYYRQVEAFLADAQLLCLNCETYNVSTSSIAQNSRSIYSALLSQVLRHFPSLLRGENWDPQGDCRVFAYPPNDFIEGFPDDDLADSVEDQRAMATPPSPPAASVRRSAEAAARIVPGTQDMTSPARSRAASALSPMHRASRNAAVAAVARVAEEEMKAEDSEQSSSSARNRPRSKSDEIKAVLSNISKQLNSPVSTERVSRTATAKRNQQQQQDLVLSPVQASGPRIRTTSGSSSKNSTPTRAPKRRRQQASAVALALPAAIAAIDSLMEYDDLLEKLTTAQRELLKRQCQDDLSTVLRDFHEALSQLDENDIFAYPVTEDVAPGYFSIITHPMDFGTMAERIDDYQDFAEYYDDLYLTLSNAITYNSWEGFIGDVVKELQAHFVKFLLDAIGGGKPDPSAAGQRRRGSQTGSLPSSATSKSQKAKLKAPAKASKAKAKSQRKRNIVSDEEEEEEEEFDSEEEEEEEEEEEDDEDDDESDESDWGSTTKRKRPKEARSPAKPKRRRS